MDAGVPDHTSRGVQVAQVDWPDELAGDVGTHTFAGVATVVVVTIVVVDAVVLVVTVPTRRTWYQYAPTPTRATRTTTVANFRMALFRGNHA